MTVHDEQLAEQDYDWDLALDREYEMADLRFEAEYPDVVADYREYGWDENGQCRVTVWR